MASGWVDPLRFDLGSFVSGLGLGTVTPSPLLSNEEQQSVPGMHYTFPSIEPRITIKKELEAFWQENSDLAKQTRALFLILLAPTFATDFPESEKVEKAQESIYNLLDTALPFGRALAATKAMLAPRKNDATSYDITQKEALRFEILWLCKRLIGPAKAWAWHSENLLDENKKLSPDGQGERSKTLAKLDYGPLDQSLQGLLDTYCETIPSGTAETLNYIFQDPPLADSNLPGIKNIIEEEIGQDNWANFADIRKNSKVDRNIADEIKNRICCEFDFLSNARVWLLHLSTSERFVPITIRKAEHPPSTAGKIERYYECYFFSDDGVVGCKHQSSLDLLNFLSNHFKSVSFEQSPLVGFFPSNDFEMIHTPIPVKQTTPEIGDKDYWINNPFGKALYPRLQRLCSICNIREASVYKLLDEAIHSSIRVGLLREITKESIALGKGLWKGRSEKSLEVCVFYQLLHILTCLQAELLSSIQKTTVLNRPLSAEEIASYPEYIRVFIETLVRPEVREKLLIAAPEMSAYFLRLHAIYFYAPTQRLVPKLSERSQSFRCAITTELRESQQQVWLLTYKPDDASKETIKNPLPEVVIVEKDPTITEPFTVRFSESDVEMVETAEGLLDLLDTKLGNGVDLLCLESFFPCKKVENSQWWLAKFLFNLFNFKKQKNNLVEEKSVDTLRNEVGLMGIEAFPEPQLKWLHKNCRYGTDDELFAFCLTLAPFFVNQLPTKNPVPLEELFTEAASAILDEDRDSFSAKLKLLPPSRFGYVYQSTNQSSSDISEQFSYLLRIQGILGELHKIALCEEDGNYDSIALDAVQNELIPFKLPLNIKKRQDEKEPNLFTPDELALIRLIPTTVASIEERIDALLGGKVKRIKSGLTEQSVEKLINKLKKEEKLILHFKGMDRPTEPELIKLLETPSQEFKPRQEYVIAISNPHGDTNRLSLYTELGSLEAPKTPNITSWKTTLTAVDAIRLAKVLDCTLSEKAKILFTQALIIS